MPSTMDQTRQEDRGIPAGPTSRGPHQVGFGDFATPLPLATYPAPTPHHSLAGSAFSPPAHQVVSAAHLSSSFPYVEVENRSREIRLGQSLIVVPDPKRINGVKDVQGHVDCSTRLNGFQTHCQEAMSVLPRPRRRALRIIRMIGWRGSTLDP
ncbi:hypothetical protein BDZ97DRAFT_1821528 [Flammula alnicola]|nr:hypothetical protein BDZ97DRAFT_1821528 [Flammula alnicola]